MVRRVCRELRKDEPILRKEKSRGRSRGFRQKFSFLWPFMVSGQFRATAYQALMGDEFIGSRG
jgi:hypothetical protein